MTSNVLIIAEVGSVHDGSFGNACKLIELAANCGADAVKFQTHIPSAETTKNAPMPSYFTGEPRYEYFARTGFTAEQWKKLSECAHKNNIEFMSSPFSDEAVDLLEAIGISRYKIPSGEVTNIPMLQKIAKTKKPVLLSSGMSNWGELDAAVSALQTSGCTELSVMQCSSRYPCENSHVGLNIIGEMRARWNLPIGYSDHTLDNDAAIAAVSLGAQSVEKHLTFSRYMYGSDAAHSAEPNQFMALVKSIRAVETMLQNPVSKDAIDDYGGMKNIFQKSVVSIVEIPKGSIITREMIGFKKPGSGIPAADWEKVVGRKAKNNIAVDTLISHEMME
ncbi:MAG: N-acetylneuraminate synthase family protein [Rickettsiales bacterium]|jgi:N,N'-diacetyllegionaminate synthase